MTPTKHPDQIAWEKWRDSPEGQKATTHYTLPSNGERSHTELSIRFEAAFQAGVKAGREGK